MKHKDFFMLPNNIFSLKLKPRDLAVLACLIRHKDNKMDSCFPSRSLIAKECCIDAKTVDAALKELEDLSIILKQHRLRENGSHTSNLYFIADIFTMTQNNGDPGTKEPEPAPVSDDPQKSGTTLAVEENTDTGVCGHF